MKIFMTKDDLIGTILDAGPFCGLIEPFIKSHETENFELHFKYDENISKIKITSGSLSETYTY
jgi:hypothetical protein